LPRRRANATILPAIVSDDATLLMPAAPDFSEPETPPPPPEPEAPPPPTRWRRFLDRARRALPWASMAMGVVSALLLDRRPERAWTVPLAVGVAWVLLTVMLVLHRNDAPPTKLRAAAQWTSLALAQSVFQMTVFFVLPLYWQSAAPTSGHVVFLALLGGLGACALWDPLFQWLFRRPFVGIPMLALAGFAGLVATLPFFGLGTSLALWIAAGATLVAAPAVAWLVAAREGRRKAVVATAVLGAALAASLWAGGAAIVPAAPLRVVAAGIGTGVDAKTRELLGAADRFTGRPRQVFCHTAVWAPLGLGDRLVHVWRHGDRVAGVVPLTVRGGRDKGFRTWSKKSAFGGDPRGEWTCSVETSSGQVLARRAFAID
jgi:hypothetical protein